MRNISKPTDLLVIGTSKDYHIDRVLKHVKSDISICRFDVDRYPTKITIDIAIKKGRTEVIVYDIEKHVRCDITNVKSVWFRRIGSPQLDESIRVKAHRAFSLNEIDHILNSLSKLLSKAKWINDFWATKQASLKPYQLVVADMVGLDFPNTWISNSPEYAKQLLYKSESLIYKTLSSPSIDYETHRGLVFTQILGMSDLDKMEDVRFTPCQFQTPIVKSHELRITYIGGDFFSVSINSQQHVAAINDWRAGADEVSYSPMQLPEMIERKLDKFMLTTGLLFGAIDMIVTPNEDYFFLEVNPHGAWGWIEDASALPISKNFGRFLSLQARS